MIIPDLQYTPTLNISEEQYHDADNVTVTVKWAQQVGVTYTIKVSPWVPLIYNGSTSLQLTISYNTDFNFSIEAITPCRDNITVSIRLQYGKILCVLAIAQHEHVSELLDWVLMLLLLFL